MKRELGLSEAVLVSTCNRVEYFGATTGPVQAAEAWPAFLRRFMPSARTSRRSRSSCAASRAWSISSPSLPDSSRWSWAKPKFWASLRTPTPSHARRGRRASGSTAFSSPPSPRPSRCARARPSRAAASRSARLRSSWRKRFSATCAAAMSWSSARARQASARRGRCSATACRRFSWPTAPTTAPPRWPPSWAARPCAGTTGKSARPASTS